MNNSWNSFAESVCDKKIICYGAGVNAYMMLLNSKFAEFAEKVLFFIDMNHKKHNTKLKVRALEFDIKSFEAINEVTENFVMLITISDYINVSKDMEQKGIEWFSWTVISADYSFNELESNIHNDKRACFLLNTPDYMNLGDHAIAIAEKKYINRNFGCCYEFGTSLCHTDGLKRLKKHVKPDDIIFVQGGGNMGSLWRVCEENIRAIIKTFCSNKIVIFPQSIYYENNDEAIEYFNSSIEIYNNHPDLTICCRDEQSYNFVTQNYKCGCLLMPDMVLTLKYSRNYKRNGIGVLVREDKEKQTPGNFSEIISNSVKQLHKELIPITHHPMSDPNDRVNNLNNVFDLYSSCELVITDRLHGMIFSAITDTPCIVFDNSYGKISSLYKTWLKACNSITFSDNISLNELNHIIENKLNAKHNSYNEKYFVEKLDELTRYIKR